MKRSSISETAVGVCVSGLFGYALNVAANAGLAKLRGDDASLILLVSELARDVAPEAVIYTLCGLVVLLPLRQVLVGRGLDRTVVYVGLFPALVLLPDILLLIIGLGADSSVTIGNCLASVRGFPTACGLVSLSQTLLYKAAVAATSGLIFSVLVKRWKHERVG